MLRLAGKILKPSLSHLPITGAHRPDGFTGETERAETYLCLCSSNGTPERSGRTPALPYPLVSKFIVQLCVGQNIKLLRYCEAEITSPDQGLASSRTGMAAETRS